MKLNPGVLQWVLVVGVGLSTGLTMVAMFTTIVPLRWSAGPLSALITVGLVIASQRMPKAREPSRKEEVVQAVLTIGLPVFLAVLLGIESFPVWIVPNMLHGLFVGSLWVLVSPRKRPNQAS